MRLIYNILAHHIKKMGESIPQVVMSKIGVTTKLTNESVVNRVRFPACTFKAYTIQRDIVP